MSKLTDYWLWVASEKHIQIREGTRLVHEEYGADGITVETWERAYKKYRELLEERDIIWPGVPRP